MAVTNVAELNALVERVKKAQREYASFTQEQVDKIFRAAALAAAEGACAVTSYDALGGLQSLEALQQRIDAGWETL